MLWFCRILLLICILAIIWQDFRSRMISLWLVIIFFLTNTTVYVLLNSFQEFFYNVIFCSAYFLLCFGLIWIYYLLKGRKSEKILDEKIGWGDVAVFFIIGFSLEPVLLIFFFTVSFILSLIIYLIFLDKNRAIPLAGLVLIFYSLFFALSLILNPINLIERYLC